MADIKVKETKKGTIKTLDKKLVNAQKIKNNLILAKEKTKETYESNNGSGTDYATDKITTTMSNAPNNVYKANRIGINSCKQTKQNLYQAKENIKQIQRKSAIKNRAKKIAKIRKNTIRTSRTTIKTSNRTIKGARYITRATIGAMPMARLAMRTTIRASKMAIKATITSIKTLISGTKALVSALIAGGWVAITVIILICLIAMLCSSVYGIFFSSENSINDRNMSSVVLEINNEFANRIAQIQSNTKYDEYNIKSNRAEWQDILAVYAVKISNGEDNAELMTLSEEKIQVLKNVFWDMNKISSNTKKEIREIEIVDENGNIQIESIEHIVLNITVTSKSIEDMILQYNFNEKQKEQLLELTEEKFNSMWLATIYGSSLESNDIITVAKQQIGNVGGEPYWSWYGFTSRVEWCACFVSWCANECGYIESGIVPKFASCQYEGVKWFKQNGVWQDSSYIPQTRRHNLF